MSFLRSDESKTRYCCPTIFGREPHSDDCPRQHCDDPIRCSTCLAEKAAKATARRAAARKGASRRAR